MISKQRFCEMSKPASKHWVAERQFSGQKWAGVGERFSSRPV
jgi:hypothetical protein